MNNRFKKVISLALLVSFMAGNSMVFAGETGTSTTSEDDTSKKEEKSTEETKKTEWGSYVPNVGGASFKKLWSLEPKDICGINYLYKKNAALTNLALLALVLGVASQTKCVKSGINKVGNALGFGCSSEEYNEDAERCLDCDA